MTIRERYEAEWLKRNSDKTLDDMQRCGDFYYDDSAQAGWHWWQIAWDSFDADQRESDPLARSQASPAIRDWS